MLLFKRASLCQTGSIDFLIQQVCQKSGLGLASEM